ncbi:unnamed protein product [[Candida] boidinii]|uniref:Histone acetyltransferase GCN5 n=1 Tax=Candida boidinii TaxID=5477 RepID=A0A9W6WCV6_CANBO|nr:hypothetical protein BVG19_g4564 [[Candida] boidinii]OWB53293.1 hypothetical protein B5S27_g4886 [[Candida] boidinii]GME78262.1 unnamed protein product [[Candida] boidinii]
MTRQEKRKIDESIELNSKRQKVDNNINNNINQGEGEDEDDSIEDKENLKTVGANGESPKIKKEEQEQEEQEKGQEQDKEQDKEEEQETKDVNGGDKSDEKERDDKDNDDNDNDNDKEKDKNAEEDKDVDEEEKQRVISFQFDEHLYTYKERPSVLEERSGKIEFKVVNNDNSRESMIILTGLKNIFQKQLPEMPKAYIARLVYDRSHISIAVVRDSLTVVGGITYRPFENHEFAEIVFCAISSTEQVRGYGAHLMNHLKDYVRNTSIIKYFLTYADNYAIGYFKKQGFTKDITLPKKVWMGYIKDYEGGTLMQCSMLPRIRYLDSPKILTLQKAAILRKIRSLSQSHIIRPGLKNFLKPNFKPMNPMDVPGVKEAGWTPEMDQLAQKPKRSPHHGVMFNLLSDMQNHPSSWPFVNPVNKEEVPDYYEVIKEPMDLSTMEIKLENDAYEEFDDFIYDCKLIFNNCKRYNGESTTFYKNAMKLEKFIANKLKDLPEYTQYVDQLLTR